MKVRKVIAILLSAVVGGGLVAAATSVGVLPLGKNLDIATVTEPFYGQHQNGIETERQAHSTLVALDLKADKDLAAVGRMMRVLTSDAALLTQGSPIIGDPQSEMAENPARLTINFSFGYSLFEKIGVEKRWPISEKEIPAYSIDKLEKRWSDGDLLVQVSGDNPQSIFHAVHTLVKESAPFATIRWQQRGFLDPAQVNVGEDSRNLMGQIDGTANAPINSKEFKERTWRSSGALKNGTTVVVRRIQLNLGTWDRLSSNMKGDSLGRELADGKKLTKDEHFSKSHVGRAFTSNNLGITRRGYNYDDNYLPSGVHDVGLIFITYQESLSRYLRIQESLNEQDELNRWTTPIGSALFVAPAGVREGDWIGSKFFAS
jgi:dye decolorizing peroxidase